MLCDPYLIGSDRILEVEQGMAKPNINYAEHDKESQ